MSKLYNLSAGIITDLKEKAEHEFNDFHLDPEYVDLNEINQRALIHLKSLPIKRGDVVHFDDCDEYRNSGKMIYDGQKLLFLDDKYDEYGHLPKEFTLNEFKDKHYFLETISHNCLIWADFTNYQIISSGVKKYKFSHVKYIKIADNTSNDNWYLLYQLEDNHPEPDWNSILKNGIYDAGYDIEDECLNDFGPNMLIAVPQYDDDN